MASWHLAYNASVAAIENPKQPRLALRLKAQREYFHLGEDFLLRGIENNPDHALLYERLATIYRDKLKDPAKASYYYDQAAKQSDAMPYVHRFAAYELAKVPGKEREAYERLKALYDKGKQEHLPTLLHSLGNLEEKLNIPTDQRILKTPPQKQ
jgi:TPR repeat protein